jgi:hypothetical protein
MLIPSETTTSGRGMSFPNDTGTAQSSASSDISGSQKTIAGSCIYVSRCPQVFNAKAES